MWQGRQLKIRLMILLGCKIPFRLWNAQTMREARAMTKTNDKPNIFNYATKELSQDAVICWLIDWAGRQGGQDEGDKALHECGRRFVKALLAEHGARLDGAIEKIEIRQQDHSIDVLARINDYVLLIEDKTSTGDHSGQLKRYYEAVAEGKTGLGEVSEETLFPIFLKTGNQSLAEENRIEESVEIDGRYGYRVFNRKEFLEKVLNHYKGSNPILTDFRAYLQAWEDDTNSFKDWKKGESPRWSWNAWQGFLRRLEGKLTHCRGWGYVPNPQGGFLGLWWSVNDIEGGEAELYLQLEIVTGKPDVQKLCFKLAVGNKEYRGAMKDKWRKLVRDAGGEAVELPRTRSGVTMTITLWKNPWLAFSDGTLDLDKTVANLKEAEAVLAKAIEMEKRQGVETQS